MQRYPIEGHRRIGYCSGTMPSDDFLSSLRDASGRGVPVAVLAPLSGVTDVAFRRLAARFGAGFVVTEMVAADGYLRGDQEGRLRAEGERVYPHVVQLVGRDAGRMAEAARLAEGAGADAVDINFGCPAKRVTGGLAGSALMREPDLALAIVAAVVGSVSCPVTVKMRLGWDDTRRNAADLAAAAAAIGVRAVTVHGRTRQQFYQGSADWSAIAAVSRRVPIPVIANGDVDGLSSARRCLSLSGADAVMIGRAAMGQPWLVGRVSAALRSRPWSEPSLSEKADAALEHYEALLALYGREVGLRHARKHLAAYEERAAEAGFGLSPACRRELLTSTETARVSGLLARIYDEPVRKAA